MLAATKGLHDVATRILERKDFKLTNRQDAVGDTILNVAVKYGLVDLVSVVLVSPSFTEANTPSADGRTALHWAVLRAGVKPNEGMKMVRSMLESIAFTAVTVQDNDGCTALHLAASVGDVGLVRILSQHIDKNVANTAGQTARNIAEL